MIIKILISFGFVILLGMFFGYILRKISEDEDRIYNDENDINGTN